MYTIYFISTHFFIPSLINMYINIKKKKKERNEGSMEEKKVS